MRLVAGAGASSSRSKQELYYEIKGCIPFVVVYGCERGEVEGDEDVAVRRDDAAGLIESEHAVELRGVDKVVAHLHGSSVVQTKDLHTFLFFFRFRT